MSSQLLSCLVLVDTGLVGQEISKHGEGCFHRSVLENLVADLIRPHRVDRLAMVPWLLLLLPVARRSGLALATRLVVSAVGVVLARRERVRVLVFSSEAVPFEEVPGTGWETSIAAHAAGDQAARQHVLSCWIGNGSKLIGTV